MNPVRLTTGKIYTDYDRVIKRVEEWVDAKNPRIAGCDGSQVKARIVQRIVEITNEEYAQQSVKYVDEPLQPLPTSSGVIVAGGIRICTKTGRISISPSQWMRNMILFTVSWLHLLMFLAVAIFRRSPMQSSAATILMEAGGGYEESDSRFVQFCRQGPIESLSAARYVIVRTKTPPRNSANSNFIYTSNPLIYLVKNFLQRSVRFSLLLRHMTAPFCFLHALVTCPVNVLISWDASFIPIVQLLDRKNLLEAIIITTSFFSSQPLWMKGLTNQQFKLNMVWYSQNFIPKMYIGEEEGSNLPAARHMRVDVHWVWTEGFKSYLRELRQTSEINVVGPIMWYLSEKLVGFGNTGIKIAVFDITPLPDEKTPFGAVKNYYSVTTIKKFVADIVELCDDIGAVSGKEVLILLKHKRPPKIGLHDSLYLEFLEQMVKSKPNFELISPQTNMFGLLETCDLSVSVPYTSTVYVASSMAKPAIYYDPFAELVPVYERNEFVHFASGPEELKQLMCQCLSISKDVDTPA